MPGLLLVTLCACADGGALDAGASDAGSRDAGAMDVADGGQDSGSVSTLEVGEAYSIAYNGSEPFEVEVVARYDHRGFWGFPEDRVSVALFVRDWLDEYPNDHSTTIVDEADIEKATPVVLGDESFRDALRRVGAVVGRPPLDGPQVVLMGNEGYHLEEDGYGHHAWDLGLADEEGNTFAGAGLANEDYHVFGQPVYLPTGGVVVDVVSDLPDNVPGVLPPYDNILDVGNNMVGVHLYGNFYLYLLHFSPGSIPPEVQPGVYLTAGTFLGTVGNAGVSLAPHLHIVVYAYDETTERSWSVPAEWTDVILHGATVEQAAHAVPVTGDVVEAAP